MIAQAVAAWDLLGIGGAFGTAFGTDATFGGLMAGAVLTVSLALAGIILVSKLKMNGGLPVMFMLALGVVLSTLFGWFPVWVPFALVVLALVPVIGLFRESGASA